MSAGRAPSAPCPSRESRRLESTARVRRDRPGSRFRGRAEAEAENGESRGKVGLAFSDSVNTIQAAKPELFTRDNFHSDGAIRFRMDLPAHKDMFKAKVEDWMKTIYGDCREEIPHDAPEPKGKFVLTTTWVDAALMLCKATGKSSTGIFTLVNQTPIDWMR